MSRTLLGRGIGSRRGAALIIALILLAGLVLLGLPFLFSQSESLAGARSFANHQATSVGLDTAERYTAAIIAELDVDHLAQGGAEDAWTRYHTRLVPDVTYEDLRPDYYNLWPIAGTNITDPGRQAAVGMWISDEYGKLNPNYLSPSAWTRLLKAVNVQDWDDNDVVDSQDWDVDPAGDRDSNGNLDDDGVPGLDGDPNSNGDNDDGDSNGELAQALADLRFTLPGRRIVELEQLLLANPGHNRDTAPAGSDYRNNSGPSNRFGFRRPLTRAELERVRPYLTLATPAPGRDGLIDLGSAVVEYFDYSGAPPEHRRIILDGDPWELLRPGTAVTWPEVRNNEDYQFSRADGVAENRRNGDRTATSLRLREHSYEEGRALGIVAPPPINLHHVEDQVMKALAVNDRIPDTDLLGNLPDVATDLETAFKSLNPLRLLPQIGDPSRTEWSEMQPTGIASYGIVSLHAGAAKADPLGRVAAQRERRSIVQAVPTQHVLESRWDYQDEFHALVWQRFTSQMDSWPEAVRRLDARKPAVKGATTSAPTGLAAATQPSLATGYLERYNGPANNRKPGHLHLDTKYAFGADIPVDEGGTDGISDSFDRSQVLSGTNASDLRADGLVISGTVTVASTDTRGPLRHNNNPSLAARQLSFWFKPQAHWDQTGKVYPLLTMRTPEALCGAMVDGVLGSNELQNMLSVAYDRDTQMLVAAIAPPVIEHLSDHGPLLPFDDFATLHLDERALGQDGIEPAYATAGGIVHPLAPRLPYPGAVDAWDEDNATYTTAVSRLFKPNRVVHLMKMQDSLDPRTGDPRPFFRKDRWYHFQLVLAGDRPGMVMMIVDGMVGQDVSRNPPVSHSDMVTGDRLTLPALSLVTPLPMLVTNGLPAGGGPAYLVPSISVKPALGLRAEDLFPKRGMIRIGDEYIAYDEVVGNEFINCQRGQRQNTQTNAFNVDQRWPLTQEHLADALVVPGGYRVRLRGTLWRGGCNLDAPLHNGDPARDWAHLVKPAFTVSPEFTIYEQPPLGSGIFRVRWNGSDPTVQDLPITDPSGLILPYLPDRGVVRFNGHYLAYQSIDRAAGRLQDVTDLTTFTSLPAAAPFITDPRVDIDFPLPPDIASAPDIELVGLPLNADPVTPASWYTNAPDRSYRVVQFQHPNSGRVEWMQYDWMANGNGSGWIIAQDGFDNGNRGIERTDFVGRSTRPAPHNTTALTLSHIFPAGTPVIPVQTAAGSEGHWLATGDVVTLVPGTPSAQPDPLPIQAIVRYAAYDGLDTAGGDPFIDTKNEWFAFSAPLPRPFTTADEVDIVCGPGWAGRDLTPMDPVEQPRGTTLRLDYLSGGTLGTVPMAVLSDSDVPIAPAAANTVAGTRTVTTGGTIDALVAGYLGTQSAAWQADTNGFDGSTGNGIGIDHGVSGGTVVLSDLAQVGSIVRATGNNFFAAEMGLVNINGEVFAYRHLNDSEDNGIPNYDPQQVVKLIGRGLLDLSDPTPVAHSIGLGPTRGGQTLTTSLIAYPLPIGPVAQVRTTGMSDHQLFMLDSGLHQARTPQEHPKHDPFDAPTALICHPDGAADQATMVAFAGGISKRVRINGNNVHHTEFALAPWLRGLYNTDPTAAGNPGDLVIGWWPRYASAQPKTPQAGSEAAYLRCRRYVSAGFPVAMQGMRFDQVAEPVTIRVSGGDEWEDLLEIDARASSLRDHDWARLSPDTLSSPGDFEPSGQFSTSDFAQPVTGAEIRVWWRYFVDQSSSLDDLAEASTRTPLIQSARVRWTAPMALLSVENAQ